MRRQGLSLITINYNEYHIALKRTVPSIPTIICVPIYESLTANEFTEGAL